MRSVFISHYLSALAQGEAERCGFTFEMKKTLKEVCGRKKLSVTLQDAFVWLNKSTWNRLARENNQI